MNKPALPRLAALCGAVFAIGLFIANGNGNQPFAGPRAVLGIASLTLVLPFMSYLCGLLRAADESDGWLPSTALAAGVTGIVLKLSSGAPELALHTAGIGAGSAAGRPIEAIASAATVLSLYPLAVFCAAVAFASFRSRALPRWLATGSAVTAAGLAVNGAFISTDTVPALLLFVLWTLLASVVLLLRTRRAPAREIHAEATAAA